MPGPCAHCGAENAPFGYRRQGSLSSLPENRRTMVFICGVAACKARAKAWKTKADGGVIFARAAAPVIPENPDQGSLF